MLNFFSPQRTGLSLWQTSQLCVLLTGQKIESTTEFEMSRVLQPNGELTSFCLPADGVRGPKVGRSVCVWTSPVALALDFQQ